jgi:hypothetical protein
MGQSRCWARLRVCALTHPQHANLDCPTFIYIGRKSQIVIFLVRIESRRAKMRLQSKNLNVQDNECRHLTLDKRVGSPVG